MHGFGDLLSVYHTTLSYDNIKENEKKKCSITSLVVTLGITLPFVDGKLIESVKKHFECFVMHVI